MADILGQLGINGKLLIAQGVNFFILLVVLRAFAYTPLINLLNERRKRIEHGVRGAEEADKRLKEISAMMEAAREKADKEALALLAEAEKHAKERTQKILDEGARKADALLEKAHETAELLRVKELEQLRKDSGDLIKQALITLVELDPHHIDDNLVAQAAATIKDAHA